MGEIAQYASVTTPTTRRDLGCTVEPEKQTERNEMTHHDADRVVVFCLRDESDAVYPGVDQWANGDLFYRSVDHDTDPGSGVFTFKGEVLESNQISYRLIVERVRNRAQGRGVSRG